MKTISQICPKCSQPIPGDAPGLLCPRCLVAGGFTESKVGTQNDQHPESTLSLVFAEESPLPPGAPRKLGDYEIVEVIARGGMGIVYKAWQPGLERFVAVKTISSGLLATPIDVERFQREAKLAAKLRHPNIVSIHEIGEQEGQHFFAMDYVPGESLAALARKQPFLPEQAAQIVAAIAEAVHYAHQQGVLHRDLKPANVILSPDGPRVLDFGLARLQQEDSELTQTGAPMGSPCYMPPEQAAGKRGSISPQSDVYALGAILYELLIGRPPFQAASVAETIRLVHETDPITLRRINPALSPDLETISLKCLEKGPSRRYQSAQEVADELQRFLRDEPIWARPVRTPEKVWRWCRRKPMIASLAAGCAALLLTVAIGAPISAYRTNRARAESERSLYAARMNLASQAVRDGQISHARDLLRLALPKAGSPDMRGFEWRCLWRAIEQKEAVQTLHGLPGSVRDSAVHLVSVGDTLYNLDERKDELRAWNMNDWSPLPLPRLAQLGDSWFWHLQQQTALAVNRSNRTLTVYELPQFKKAQVIPFAGIPTQCDISPDHRLMAISIKNGDSQRLLIWDLLENKERAALGEYTARINQLQFSSDGAILAACSADGVIHFWDVTSSRSLPSPPTTEPSETFIEFVPGRRSFIYWNTSTDTLRFWAAEAVSAKRSIFGLRFGLNDFSRDGRLLAMQSGDVVEVLDTESFLRIGLLRGHQAELKAVAFSPDARLIATAGWDRTARLWDLKTERELAILGGHEESVYAVVFSADGNQLVSISADGLAKVWDVSAVLERNLFFHSSTPQSWVRIPADEHLMVSSDLGGKIHIWDRLNRKEMSSLQTDSRDRSDVSLALEPGGYRLAWRSRSSVGVFDIRSGQTSSVPIRGNQGAFDGIAFSPDQEVMFGSHDKVLVWDLASSKVLPFANCDQEVFSIAYSPDGTLVAFGHEGGTVSLWHRKSARRISVKPAHAEMTATVVFSHDGKRLASCGTHTIQLWNVERDGITPLGEPLRGHAGYIRCVDFSPDGARLVSAGSDHTLKLWDSANRVELATLYGHQASVWGVAFSNDGLRVYSGGTDGDLRAWEAPPLADIDPSRPDGDIHVRTERLNQSK